METLSSFEDLNRFLTISYLFSRGRFFGAENIGGEESTKIKKYYQSKLLTERKIIIYTQKLMGA